MTDKWEHRVLEVQASATDATQTRLDSFGLTGWELIAATAIGATQFLYMKRKRQAPLGGYTDD